MVSVIRHLVVVNFIRINLVGMRLIIILRESQSDAKAQQK